MDEHILLLRDGQRGKITKSHKAFAALTSLLTVNWPLVRTMPNLITAAECWQIVIAVKPSFTPSVPTLRYCFWSETLYINLVKKCRHQTSEERNTAHTRCLNNVMSWAINEETKKFVLTSNQTKDQRRSGTFKITGLKVSLVQLI